MNFVSRQALKGHKNNEGTELTSARAIHQGDKIQVRKQARTYFVTYKV